MKNTAKTARRRTEALLKLSNMGEQHEAAGVLLVSELELLCALLLQTAGLSLPDTA